MASDDLFVVIEDAAQFEQITTGDDIRSRYPIPEQPPGPFQRHDKTMRCASRGCASPTYHTVMMVPYCNIHAMLKMNEMLFGFGVERPKRGPATDDRRS